MPVVDAHVHIFPEEVIRYRERFVERDQWFGQLYSSSSAKLASMDDLVESMAGAGIDLSIACGFPWEDHGLCEFHNDYMFEAARKHPARIAWLAIVSPVHSERSVLALDDAFGKGASGVGELNADAQRFDLMDTGQLRGIVDVCIANAKPAMFHVSEPLGHGYPGKGASTPDKLVNVLEAFPNLKVVAAHWGGGLPFYELMPEIRTAARNLVYDSAATTYLYQHRVFETVTELAGYERVLFATDYPVLKQAPLLARVRERPGLSGAALAAILGENAVRFYGLGEMFA